VAQQRRKLLFDALTLVTRKIREDDEEN